MLSNTVFFYTEELAVVRSAAVADLEDHKRAEAITVIYSLDPIVDYEGILRVRGRLKRAELNYCCQEIKHPALLLKDRQVSRLIINHYYRQVRYHRSWGVLFARQGTG